MVREIYSLRETLTKNFEVNSTNVTESNERTNEQTYERTNGQTSRRKLYTPRHKCRGYKNYIPRGINAGGIINLTLKYNLSNTCMIKIHCLSESDLKKQSLALILIARYHYVSGSYRQYKRPGTRIQYMCKLKAPATLLFFLLLKLHEQKHSTGNKFSCKLKNTCKSMKF